MSRYIEFTTASHPFETFTLGNPVHDGVVPSAYTEINGVRVDGEEVIFKSEDIPDRLHKSLVDGHELERRRHDFECNIFALLMFGIDLVRYRGRQEFSLQHTILESETSAVIDCQSAPLALGAMSRWMRSINYLHTVVPAFTEEETYLHKLGNKGPVCLSDLPDAMNMFGCNRAKPIMGITVTARRKFTAEWCID